MHALELGEDILGFYEFSCLHRWACPIPTSTKTHILSESRMRRLSAVVRA